jgi:hypothetical protein
MGIRTPVAGVRGPHDWPDYTIAANCSITSGLLLHKFVDSTLGKPVPGMRLRDLPFRDVKFYLLEYHNGRLNTITTVNTIAEK